MRLKFVDILKGIAIFLVVLGHTAPINSFVVFCIFSFHMPLFFIIAGYLFNFEKYENNFKGFFKGRFLRLILPYFMSIILFLLYYLLYQCPNPFVDTPASAIINIFKANIIGALYGVGAINKFNIEPIGPLWFLVALFGAELLFYFSCKLMKNWNIWIKYVLYFIISYLGILIGKKIFLPLSFDISMVSIFFIFIGYELRRNQIIEKLSNNKNTVIYFIGLIIGCILWYVLMSNSLLSMNNRDYHNTIYAFSCAILASVILFSVCYKIQNLSLFSVFNKIFSYLGVETLIILVMHNRIIVNTPELSCLRYNYFIFAIYLILFSLMIGIVMKYIPILKQVYYPNINKRKK